MSAAATRARPDGRRLEPELHRGAGRPPGRGETRSPVKRWPPTRDDTPDDDTIYPVVPCADSTAGHRAIHVSCGCQTDRMRLRHNTLAFAACVLLLGSTSRTLAQDPARLATKADVEKAAGARFNDGWKSMPTRIAFAEDGGNVQVSVTVVPREAQGAGYGCSLPRRADARNRSDLTTPGRRPPRQRVRQSRTR
jgi:hypothetical protein